MDYKVLYRKYRPEDFENIVDQDFIIKTLKNAIKTNKISHAYLFSGPRGTGKTTTAKVFAKSINCENYDDGPCNKCASCVNFGHYPDIIEIDAASNNGVDDVRELINNVKLAPSMSKYKVYIIDEVHMLTTNAFNALLLTLEEPPSNVVFILATTNIESVPITILSRCQRFDFKQISFEALKSRLKYVAKSEKISIEDDAIDEICLLSEGGLRDALSILDQLSSQNDKITLEIVQKSYNIVGKETISKLYTAFVNNDIKILEIINNIEERGYDYKNVIKSIINSFYEKMVDDYSSFNNIDRIKNLIFELNKIINEANIYVSPYTLLKTVMLSYYDVDDKTNDESISNVSQKEDVNVKEDYFPGNKIDNDKKNIRINNTFVDPDKKYLQEVQDKWKSFISIEKDSKVLSLLIDSNIVVSSHSHSIICTDLEATSHLINATIENIEKKFNKKFNTKLKLVAVCKEEWDKLKKEYINNLKNKIQYELIEENVCVQDELNNIASDIFASDKIEME